MLKKGRDTEPFLVNKPLENDVVPVGDAIAFLQHVSSLHQGLGAGCSEGMNK